MYRSRPQDRERGHYTLIANLFQVADEFHLLRGSTEYVVEGPEYRGDVSRTFYHDTGHGWSVSILIPAYALPLAPCSGPWGFLGGLSALEGTEDARGCRIDWGEFEIVSLVVHVHPVTKYRMALASRPLLASALSVVQVLSCQKEKSYFCWALT